MAKAPEIVYAIHNFEAENEDEITFYAGEPIVVIEKDEQYLDGWWQGRDQRGHVGLFPMNYTSPVLPVGATGKSPLLNTSSTSLLQMDGGMASQQSLSMTMQLPLPQPVQPLPQLPAAPPPPAAALSSPPPLSPQARAPSSMRASSPSQQQQPLGGGSNNGTGAGGGAPEAWDVNHVCAWLDSVGLANVKDTFIEQEITGDVLLDLTMDSLKEMGIPAYGRRYKIMTAINKLNGNENGPVPKPSVSSQLPTGGADGSNNKRFVPSVISSTTSSSLNGHPNHSSLIETANHIRSTLSSPVDSESLYQFPRKAPAPPSSSVSSSSNGHDSSSHRMRPISSTSAESSSNNSSIHRSNTFNTTSSSGAGTLKSGSGDHQPPPPHPSSFLHHQHSPNNSHHRARQQHQQPAASHSAPTSTTTTARSPGQQPYVSGHEWFQQEMSARIQQAPEQKLSIASIDSARQRISSDEFQAPEHEGWLHKQSDRYKTWNKRWFVLKGNNLFYFKSPRDVRVKGIINLRGYRVIVDETIHSNKYCFKTQHDQERTFFFYTDTKESMRAWLQALMKATIVRDFTSPVMSSNQVATVPLDVAQRMRPRPPSVLMYKPTGLTNEPTMGRVQEEEDEDDDAIPASAAAAASATLQSAMPLAMQQNQQNQQNQQHQQHPLHADDSDNDDDLAYTLPVPPSHANDAHHDSDEEIDPYQRAHQHLQQHTRHFDDDDDDEDDEHDEDADEDAAIEQFGGHHHHHRAISSTQGDDVRASATTTTTITTTSERSWSNMDYVDWINQYLPDGKKVVDLSSAFRNGDTLILLLESLSSKVVRRTPDQKGGSVSMKVLDNIVAAFKFMGREGVVVDGRYTIKDIFGGHEDKIMDMVDAIKMWADTNGYTAERSSTQSSSSSSNQQNPSAPSLTLPDLNDSFSKTLLGDNALQQQHNDRDETHQLQDVA